MSFRLESRRPVVFRCRTSQPDGERGGRSRGPGCRKAELLGGLGGGEQRSSSAGREASFTGLRSQRDRSGGGWASVRYGLTDGRTPTRPSRGRSQPAGHTSPAVVCDRSLYLRRLDKLGDPWEGVWPAKTLEALEEGVLQATQAAINNLDEVKASLRTHRAENFANCWHASGHESAALWGLYSRASGVAIKSTCARLKSAIKGDSRTSSVRCPVSTTQARHGCR